MGAADQATGVGGIGPDHGRLRMHADDPRRSPRSSRERGPAPTRVARAFGLYPTTADTAAGIAGCSRQAPVALRSRTRPCGPGPPRSPEAATRQRTRPRHRHPRPESVTRATLARP
ncbi:hypothetical protein GCM10009544_38150 [Streptomyces stramineus]|uniref:Uncharacterized protein n=1 Tax=Streptomyces stramineus TaxID=173861 RepID=A0ABN1ABT3_9ACTN